MTEQSPTPIEQVGYQMCAPPPLGFDPGITPPAVDFTAYLHFLDDCDWSETEKAEFIAELWKIVVGFVDVGFGVHPIQLIATLEADSKAVLDSEKTITSSDSIRVASDYQSSGGHVNEER